MKFICLDTETTGLNYKTDKILDIGCINVYSDEIFQTYINPEMAIPIESTKIHGITNEMVAKFKSFKHYAQDFLNFIENSTLIIHNAKFDLNFLNKHLEEINLPKLTNPVIDTLELARQKFPPNSKLSLDALKQKFNIDIERKFHGALLDAKILKFIYLQLIQTQTNLELSSEVKQMLTKKTITQKQNNTKIEASTEEIEKHKEIISAL